MSKPCPGHFPDHNQPMDASVYCDGSCHPHKARPLTAGQLEKLRCLLTLERANGSLNRYERGDLTSLVRRGLVKSVVSYGVVKTTFYGLTERGRQVAQKEASK